MKKPRLRSLLALAALALLWGTSDAFAPEILALAWHARYGSTAQMRNFGGTKRYSVKVPFWSAAHLDDSGSSLMILHMPGRATSKFRKEWSTIAIRMGQPYVTGENLERSAPLVQAKTGVSFTELSRLNLAGQDTACFETKQGRGEAAELSRRLSVVDITCVPLTDKQGWTASYLGTSGGLDEFYGVLKSVMAVR